MRLRNLNLAPRAALFFTSIIVLVFVLGVFAVLQMGKLRDAEKDVELNWMASIRQTALMNTTILRLRLETQRGLADPQSIQKTIESFAGYRKAFTEAVANYEPLIADEKERSFYIPVKNSADAYAKQLDILEPLMRQGDIAAAVSLVSTSIRPLTNTMEVQIKDLTNFNNEGAARAGQTATDLYENGLWLVVGLIAGVVILTVGLALLLTKSITSPINDALSVAERIAASDLS
ncbi:MCP four helix bundle domain-containing protein, partial [Pseudomonas savastanoi]